jgi:hypothetical protein
MAHGAEPALVEKHPKVDFYEPNLSQRWLLARLIVVNKASVADFVLLWLSLGILITAIAA